MQKLDLQIDENADAPVYEQLANEMRRLICAHKFSPGQQVPSIRMLAEQLDVSPTTVRRAFQILIDEGWLNQLRGSGTYVAPSIELQTKYLAQQEPAVKHEQTTCTISPLLLSGTWGEQVSKIAGRRGTAGGGAVELNLSADASPAGVNAPVAANILTRYIDECLDSATRLTSPSGMLELREQIANWVTVSRSIECSGSDILIVSGRRQARSMVARLFGGEGSTIIFEDPSSLDARELFKSFAWNINAVPVDESGIVIEELERQRSAQALYLRPSSQFPSGAVLSKMRRERIAQWSAATGAIVVEDDAGCDFSYESRVTAAVSSFVGNERSIYIGSFSHVLPPAWQIAFIVVPASMREAFYRMKLVADRCTAPAVQNILNTMMRDGQLNRIVTRLQREYSKLRDELVHQLADMPAGSISFTPVKGGLHQAIWLASALEDARIVDDCLEEGVAFTALSPLFTLNPARPGLLINFAAADNAGLRHALSVLRNVIGRHHGA